MDVRFFVVAVKWLIRALEQVAGAWFEAKVAVLAEQLIRVMFSWARTA